MKCPYCNQEMIDTKEFCVNCGKRLIKEKKTVNLKAIIILFTILVVAGFITCYAIINYNTDKEIAPYIKEKVNNEENN